MKHVKIYTTSSCPYCLNAKRLLKSKGVEFEEINIEDNFDYIVSKLSAKSKVYTVPQIYVDDRFIGGCDDIYMLERQNKLDEALQ